jgi:hypothetical protein
MSEMNDYLNNSWRVITLYTNLKNVLINLGKKELCVGLMPSNLKTNIYNIQKEVGDIDEVMEVIRYVNR